MRQHFKFLAKVILGITLMAGVIGSISVGLIANSQGTSYSSAGRIFLRQVALSGIQFFCSIYDPWSTAGKYATLSPPCSSTDVTETEIPVESFLNSVAEKWNFSAKPIVNNQKNIVGDYPFYYEMPNPRLEILRQEMALDDVVADANNEFEELVLLRNWTRTRFRRIDYQEKKKNFDALDVLQNIRVNKDERESLPGDIRPCDVFPRLYIQVLLSMGYQARLCQVSHNGLGHHGLTEVWSNQYNKWITMDADLNLHYLRNGIPQNLLEIHRAASANDLTIQIDQNMVDLPYQPNATLEWMYSYHRFINIADMRNDWISNTYFAGHPRQSDRSFLGWFDGVDVPLIFFLKPTTREESDFYWSLNRTQLFVVSQGSLAGNVAGNAIPLLFKTVTPNFDHFEIQVDKTTYEQKECNFLWALHKGLNTFTVKSVNLFGREGVVSSIEIRL